MIDQIVDRERLVSALRAELFGPAPAGTPIDTHKALIFRTLRESYGPFTDLNGEEILSWDRPVARYGIGVLFPKNRNDEPTGAGAVDEVTEQREVEVFADAAALVSEDASRQLAERIAGRTARDNEKQDELDLSATTSRRPSSIGLSFLIELAEQDEIRVEATGGRYDVARVAVGDRDTDRRWFVRRKWNLTATFGARDVIQRERHLLAPSTMTREQLDGLDISVAAFARRRHDGTWLVTITLVNQSSAGRAVDPFCLFQIEMSITTLSNNRVSSLIRPYPAPPLTQLDDEEQSLALLYRQKQAFAVGHGCSADWEDNALDRVAVVKAQMLPAAEVPSITPDISDENGPVTVSMQALAGLEDGESSISRVLELYAGWIASQKSAAAALPSDMREVADRHIDACESALERMHAGAALVLGDQVVAEAFRLANHAMLLQQIRTSMREPRLAKPKRKGVTQIEFQTPYPVVSHVPPNGRGSWRPFQIAFILMCLPSVANGEDVDRERVELIWFPTGGGKTEAYLGLTAFSLFLRRLRDTHDVGVDVLMRYTLRLLTAQQFQRASALVCAMEYLRKNDQEHLGDHPFSIGIWLGGDTTPNSRKDAQRSLRELHRKPSAENPFLLSKCPWCGAQIGPIPTHGVVGYGWDGTTVRMHCSDSACEFAHRLPVLVIDEDLYAEPPSMIIGTVDKFAMLAWRPEARSLFGIGRDGNRIASPPNVVIQDELHLVSGPLGTMVGLYEAVVEELCTDRRRSVVKPKIITSTATARRFGQQVRSLFARDKTSLFPPPGLNIVDSFFASYAKNVDGSLKPGRLYVGVHATNHNSLITTQVQATATMLQAPVSLPQQERDPWWTLLVFFNTLRELGTSLSLVHSNVPMHLKAMRNRRAPGGADPRFVDRVQELTGRLRNDEIPKVMAELEIPYGSGQGRPVDICLSSNIIEVGIDIDRLSLMIVVGQPKSTSQYIQVTGRIGRRWWERPGLVITLFNVARARDRSHYEQFRSYHERLYSQVEPTTVTPFAPPAVERALHAVLAAFVRQLGDSDASATVKPVPNALLERFIELITARVAMVDRDESTFVEETLRRRIGELKVWASRPWGSFSGDEDQVLSVAESLFEQVYFGRTWPTPLSMRNVDAECELDISSAYALETLQ